MKTNHSLSTSGVRTILMRKMRMLFLSIPIISSP
ncbi:unnamed protein product, partial [Linum tenue]